MVVVVNAYSGLLIAYLTVPLLKPTMDTFEDVVNSNGLKITVELNSDLYFKFLVSIMIHTLKSTQFSI